MLFIKALWLCVVIAAADSYGSKDCFRLLRGKWYEHKWIPYPWIPREQSLRKDTKVFTLIEPGLININITGRHPQNGKCVSFNLLLRETETPCRNQCQFKVVSVINEQGDTAITDTSIKRTEYRDVIIFSGCAVRDKLTAKCTRPDAWVLMRSEFLTRRQVWKVDVILRRLGLGKYLDNGEFVPLSTGPKCQPN